MTKKKEPLGDLHAKYLILLGQKTGLGLMLLESKYTGYRILKTQANDIRASLLIYEQLAEFVKNKDADLFDKLHGKVAQLSHDVEQIEADIDAQRTELHERFSAAIDLLEAEQNRIPQREERF